MAVRMRVLAVTGRGEMSVPTWLCTYDIEAHGGRGHATYTTDPGVAATWPTAAAAMACWRQTSTTRPLRDDGKPNRPLSALSVEIESVGD